VVDVYSTGLGDQAVVSLADTGDPPSTVTVPADSLRRAGGISPGVSARLDAMAYENQVISAVRRVGSELDIQVATDRGWDNGVDAVLLSTTSAARVAMQVKFFSSGRVSSDVVAVLVGYAGSVGPMILVTNGDLTSAAAEHLRQSRRRKLSAWYVRWNGPDDDAELASAIGAAIKVRRK
jgi:Restriction endonuclease